MKLQLDNSKFFWGRDFDKILKKFKIWTNLNALIDFGQIQYQRSVIDMLYLCVVLGL